METSATPKPSNIIPPIITVEANKSAQLNETNKVEENHLVDVCKSRIPFDSTKKEENKPATSSSTWSENVRYYTAEYCEATTIHGIKYIGERGRFAIEKAFWFIVVVVVCTLCIFLVVKTYYKWIRSPVIVTFATRETGIWKIPFPAVTICPEVKSDPEVFNYSNFFIKRLSDIETTDAENRYYDLYSTICDDFFNAIPDISAQRTNFTTLDRVFDDLESTALAFDPFNITTILWLGKKYNLDDALSVTTTKEGICYSFNMLHYEEILKDADDDLVTKSLRNSKPQKWSLEGGYPNDDQQSSYPRRTFLSGMNGGFIIEGLYANHSCLDYACTQGLQGFKVTLHHPSELPNLDKHFRVPLDQAVIVAIRPRMINVSEELKSYKPEDRMCYLADERPLEFYKSYTQQNCLAECLSNYTLLECDCVPFYMPGYNDSATCGPGKNTCIETSKVNYLSNGANNCSCLPLCTALEYDVEITQSDWEWYKLFAVFRAMGLDAFPFDYKTSHFSKLAVFYKDLQFLATERHELYGYTDFFSNVGGLLGLFIGFSVISLLEILYFLSLRIVCNIKKYGQKWWSGEPQLMAAEKSQDRSESSLSY